MIAVGIADPVDAWLLQASANRAIGPARPSGAALPLPLVVDTNCVLDLWLFADPRVAALARWIRAGRARWLATRAMRAELERVLGYAAIVRQLRARQAAAADVLDAFDRWSQPVAPAPAAQVRCSDGDDQMFVDLALRWRAGLCSRDHAVLALARRLRPAGVDVMPAGFAARSRGPTRGTAKIDEFSRTQHGSRTHRIG